MNDDRIGSDLLVSLLISYKVSTIFGVVGIPIFNFIENCQKSNIAFVACRNEQAASYAAATFGYLTGRPGVCCVCSGPAFVNALSGVLHAYENKWPVLFIVGMSDSRYSGLGAFQELQEGPLVPTYLKESIQVTQQSNWEEDFKKCWDSCLHPPCGPSILEIPGDLFETKLNISVSPKQQNSSVLESNAIPQYASSSVLSNFLDGLLKAKNPLIIIGKGAAFSNAHEECRQLISRLGLPFLTMPMGRGVVPCDEKLCMNSCRSFALKNADIVLLVGARLNWMLHFGKSPPFHPNVTIAIIDNDPKEFLKHKDNISFNLIGDIKDVLKEINSILNDSDSLRILPSCAESGRWIQDLTQNKLHNQGFLDLKIKSELSNFQEKSMSYFGAFAVIQHYIAMDENTILITEGSKTMDLTRQLFKHSFPKHRLDAASSGVMGIGIPSCLAAHFAFLGRKRLLYISGDSAFGFSAMELETMQRYKIPAIIVVINNNGIYSGMSEDQFTLIQGSIEEPHLLGIKTPANVLSPNAKYHYLAASFGGHGYSVYTYSQLEIAIRAAVNPPLALHVINCHISPKDSTVLARL